MLNGKATIVLLIVAFIKMILFYSKNETEVESDLSNYATKSNTQQL